MMTVGCIMQQLPSPSQLEGEPDFPGAAPGILWPTAGPGPGVAVTVGSGRFEPHFDQSCKSVESLACIR